MGEDILRKKSNLHHIEVWITMKSGDTMGMARLWETWKPKSHELFQSCTTCTTDANPFMLEFRDRIPLMHSHVMISPSLNPGIKDSSALKPIIAQLPSAELQEWPVLKDVDNVRNQGEYLTEPLAAHR